MSKTLEWCALGAVVLGLAGCGQSMETFLIGTWQRSANEPTDFDPQSQEPTEWCTHNEHELELGEGGSYTDVQALTPFDHSDCNDAPNAITWTRKGTWTLGEASADGEWILLLEQTSEQGVYDGPRDNEMSDRREQLVFAIASQSDGETDRLYLGDLGLFERVGEAP